MPAAAEAVAIQSDAIMLRIFVIWLAGFVGIRNRGRPGLAERGPIGLPIAVSSIDAREHVFGVLHAPPGSGSLQAQLRDVAMCACQGFTIVQLISATDQIAMASPHRSLVVVHFGRFEMASERPVASCRGARF